MHSYVIVPPMSTLNRAESSAAVRVAPPDALEEIGSQAEAKPSYPFKISIIIPTFNRWSTLPRAVDSALDFLSDGAFGEVIVIDDLSTDETRTLFPQRYAKQLASGKLKFLPQEMNRGPDVARNRGSREAKGDWLLFLDSDDWLVPNAASTVLQTLSSSPSTPLLFFRCVDTSGALIGPKQDDPISLSGRMLLEVGTPGECIPVIQRDAFLTIGYDEDLRGWGGPTYYRIICQFGNAIVQPDPVRVYNMDENDRMSTRSSMLARAPNMIRGHARILRYCIKEIYLRGIVLQIAKVAYYTALSVLGAARKPFVAKGHH